MSYGLRVNNSSGFVQIDQDYANYFITQTGTVSQANSGGGYGVAATYYTGATDSTNLVFVRPQTNGVRVGAWGPYPGGHQSNAYYPTGNLFALNRPREYAPWEIPTPNPMSPVDYFTAARVNYTSHTPQPWGLRVFDDSGNVAFDSQYPYVRIAYIFNAPMSPRVTTVNLPTPPAGRKYYVCLNPLWITLIRGTDVGGGYYEDTNYGFSAHFVTDTQLQIDSQAWLNDEDFGQNRTWQLNAGHAPPILVAVH